MEKTEQSRKKHTFDPDLRPQHEKNRAAAEEHGVRWDPKRRVYVDEDGCLVRDEFGQRL